MDLINDLTVSVFFIALSVCIVLSLQFVKINQLKKIILHKDTEIKFLNILASLKVCEVFKKLEKEIKNKKAVH
mgnify:CR=1 FL=1